MPQDPNVAPAQSPDDFQEYADSRFGFKVQMPKRFEILPSTVDPLARMIRGLNELSEEEAEKLQPRLPIGFYDPAVIGELEDGETQPLRLIEYDALSGDAGGAEPRGRRPHARRDAPVPAGDPGDRGRCRATSSWACARRRWARCRRSPSSTRGTACGRATSAATTPASCGRWGRQACSTSTTTAPATSGRRAGRSSTRSWRRSRSWVRARSRKRPRRARRSPRSRRPRPTARRPRTPSRPGRPPTRPRTASPSRRRRTPESPWTSRTRSRRTTPPRMMPRSRDHSPKAE